MDTQRFNLGFMSVALSTFFNTKLTFNSDPFTSEEDSLMAREGRKGGFKCGGIPLRPQTLTR